MKTFEEAWWKAEMEWAIKEYGTLPDSAGMVKRRQKEIWDNGRDALCEDIETLMNDKSWPNPSNLFRAITELLKESRDEVLSEGDRPEESGQTPTRRDPETVR